MAPRRTCCPGQPQPSWQGSCAQGAPGCRCEQRRGHLVAQALSTWPGGQSGGSTDSGMESWGRDCLITGPLPWLAPDGTRGPSSATPEGRAGTHHPGAHQSTAPGYIPAFAPCPGPRMAPLQVPPRSSDAAPWCPHRREQSSCSRMTMAQGLGTRGVGTSGTH